MTQVSGDIDPKLYLGMQIHQSRAEVIAIAPRMIDADRTRSRSSGRRSITGPRISHTLLAGAARALCPAVDSAAPLISGPEFLKVPGRREAGNHVFGLSMVNHPAVPTLNPL